MKVKISFWERLKARFLNPRKYWEWRARMLDLRPALACHDDCWTVGRTDMLSYAENGEIVHYAYSPDERMPRVAFYGDEVSALKKAVKYAEAMNGGRL